MIAWLERCAERDPLHKSLQLLLAGQYARHGKPQRAEAIYLKWIDQMPEAEIYRPLFQLYAANRDRLGRGMSRVLEMFDETVDRASESAEKKKGDTVAAARARAMLAALREDPDLTKGPVSEALSRMTEGQSLRPPTMGFLAALAARSNQLDEAEKFYRLSLKNYPSPNVAEQAAYQGLLEVLMQGKKYPAVVEVCRQGIVQDKSSHLLIFYDYSIWRSWFWANMPRRARTVRNRSAHRGLRRAALFAFSPVPP